MAIWANKLFSSPLLVIVTILALLAGPSQASIIGWQNPVASNITFIPTEQITFTLQVNQSDLSVWNGLNLPISVAIDGTMLNGTLPPAPDSEHGIYSQAVWNDTLLNDHVSILTIYVLNISDTTQILLTVNSTVNATAGGFWTDCYADWDSSGQYVQLDVRTLVPQVTCLFAPSAGGLPLQAAANLPQFPDAVCTVPHFPFDTLPVNSIFMMTVNVTQGHTTAVELQQMNASADLTFATGSVWSAIDLSKLCEKQLTIRGQFSPTASYYCHYKSGDDDVQSRTVSPVSATELKCSVAEIENWKRLIFDAVFQVGSGGAADTVLFTELLPINFGYPNCNSWIFVVFGLCGLGAVVGLVGITIWWQRKRPEISGETERLVVS